MKLLSTILVLLNFSSSFTQQDLCFPLETEFDWEEVEKQNPALKYQVIKQWEQDFDEDCLSGIWPAFYELENLHVIDFDKDGLDDIVYEGPSNGEAQLVAFYLNTGDGFKIVLEDIQQIFRLEFENGRVTKIFLKNQGCCCSIDGENKVFIADYDFKQPKFELLYTTRFLNPTELPEKYLKTPVKINIPYKANLKLNPNDRDSVRYQLCVIEEVQANFIAEIPANSSAVQLAKQTDEKGKRWIFIAIVPETRLKNSLLSQFYISGLQQASFKLGWIEESSSKPAKN